MEKNISSNWETDSAAKLEAQKISFGPFVFQVAKVSRDLGILKAVEDAGENGIDLKTISSMLNLTDYSAKVILDASEDINTVKKINGKYFLTKTGYFILNDTISKINMDFVHDVCYKGVFHLEEAVKKNIPAGLKEFGEWSTVYEALSSLPEKAKESWFNFDHYYSDKVFSKTLKEVFKKNPSRLLDVGGNTGKWAIQCANYSNEIKVTIMDLEKQINTAKSIIEKLNFKDRIFYHPTNLLDKNCKFPEGHDAIWMSQFLDCFSEDEIVSILSRAADVMDNNTNLFILETFTDRQKFEVAKFCLDMTSLYFTCMANGNSKMYESTELIKCVENAGLAVKEDIPIGISHTLLVCKRKI